MPAVCHCLVKANLYTTVVVAVLQAVNIGASLAAQCFCEDTVCICKVCTGVGILHVVTPGVHRGRCCTSYALHYQGFVVALNDFRPLDAARIIFTKTCCIPLHFTGYASGSQAFCNSNLTLQVSTICRVVSILSLLCQCGQRCFNFSLALHVDICVISGQD